MFGSSVTPCLVRLMGKKCNKAKRFHAFVESKWFFFISKDFLDHYKGSKGRQIT
jgi:hypothetical protein